MGLLLIALLAVFISTFLLLFKPFVDEIGTVYQIIKSFFTPKINLKKRYGPWAIVTGCTEGIGKSMSFELAKRGLNIVLIGRNRAKLEKLSSEIESTTQAKTKIIVADFGKGREIYKNIEQELKDMDIGILVNNVGIAYDHPKYFSEVSDDEIWNLLHINIGAATQMTRIVLPDMVSRKRGAIVNLSSAAKLLPGPLELLYPASKMYLEYFAEGLRYEYGKYGITVQSLCPFYVSTKFNDCYTPLQKVNTFIPDADTYVRHALNTLGVIDNTTGYWPHRLQYLLMLIMPVWLRVQLGFMVYKYIRKDCIKRNANNVKS